MLLHTLHDQKVCGHRISFQKIMGLELVPPFAAITVSTLLERLSTRCWNISEGTCFHSATRVLVRSHTNVGRLDLACCQRSNSSQMCLMGFRSVLCAGQSSSSTPIPTNHFFNLCTGNCHAETGKGLPQTVSTKLEAENHLECHCML